LKGGDLLLWFLIAIDKVSLCFADSEKLLSRILTSGVHAYQDMNAIINPIVEKKNVLPYTFMGFNTGTDCALWLMGLTFGAVHSIDIGTAIVLDLRL